MNKQVSKSNKARWAKISPEERSRIMTKVSEQKYKNMSAMERALIGKRLLESRKK